MMIPIFRLFVVVSVMLIGISTHANPVFAPSITPKGTIDWSKAGVLGDIMEKNPDLLTRQENKQTCHVRYPELFASMQTSASYPLNQHVCVQLNATFDTTYLEEFHARCKKLQHAFSQFGMESSVSYPPACPTKNIVAMCRSKAERTFVYDQLVANSNEEKACKAANAHWIVASTYQRNPKAKNNTQDKTADPKTTDQTAHACEVKNPFIKNAPMRAYKHFCVQKIPVVSTKNGKSFKPLNVKQTCADSQALLAHYDAKLARGSETAGYAKLVNHCPSKNKAASCTAASQGGILNFYGDIPAKDLATEKQLCEEQGGLWSE